MVAKRLPLLLALLLASQTTLGATKVLLNPSNQTANQVAGGGTEDQFALINAKKAEVTLDAAGFDAKVDQDFTNAPANANSWGAKIFVSIHSNAGGGHGTETLFKTEADDKPLASKIQNALLAKLPYQSRGLKVRTDLHVLNSTTMAACLAEVVFHDCAKTSGYTGHPPSESAFLKSTDGQTKIAGGISQGVCDYFEVSCGGSSPTKGTLKGIVYKGSDQSARLPGAKVTLNTGSSMTTGGDALYSFELAAGTYTATASLTGYKSASVTRTVVAGQTIWGSIGLEPIVQDCDDDNPCTDDAWNGSSCTHSNNNDPCDDLDACTGGDACYQGTCQGEDISAGCDDGIYCTSDSCDPNDGCRNSAKDSRCDDDNPCTDDDCDKYTGCSNDFNSAPCDDGRPCTLTDLCQHGLCVGLDPVVCNDGLPCTSDACNPVTGLCVYTQIPGCGLQQEDTVEDSGPDTGPDNLEGQDASEGLDGEAPDGAGEDGLEGHGGQGFQDSSMDGAAAPDVSLSKDISGIPGEDQAGPEDGQLWTPEDTAPESGFKKAAGCQNAPNGASPLPLLLMLLALLLLTHLRPHPRSHPRTK